MNGEEIKINTLSELRNHMINSPIVYRVFFVSSRQTVISIYHNFVIEKSIQSQTCQTLFVLVFHLLGSAEVIFLKHIYCGVQWNTMSERIELDISVEDACLV